jgi:uncharacterized membrane protein YcaP (DUF421 family)
MFFDSWTGVVRVVVVGILAYLFLILWLRLSGKRTLATVLLSNQVALVEGVIGLGLLIGLQFVITWLSVRSVAVRRVVKSEPTLLLYRGEYMHDAMKQQRVADSEVRNAIRSRGIGAVEDVEAVILETDGNFSVIRRIEGASYSALIDVSLPDRPARTPR